VPIALFVVREPKVRLPGSYSNPGPDIEDITIDRYRYSAIVEYYWSMVIRRDEYLVTTARDLGAALKYFRTAGKVSQADAAEAAGIGQPYLSSLEGGKFGSSLTQVLRLLRYVGCEVIVRRREPRG